MNISLLILYNKFDTSSSYSKELEVPNNIPIPNDLCFL